MEPKTKDGQYEKEDKDPKTLVGLDGENGWHTAEIVPQKGVHAYAIKVVSDEAD